MRWLNWRLVVFILLFFGGVALSLPSLLNLKEGPKITLGLDLQGGLHMLLGVDTKSAIASKIKSLASAIKYFAEDNDILIEDLKIEGDKISFKLLDEDDAPKLEEFLSKQQGLNVQKEGLKYLVSLTPQEVEAVKEYAINQAVDT
ncbi:MAG: protein translocase subunit SecD, partial [Epsilonproteobacteria bacterium]|nr:protein translocase subunit SecD [Campylobacterota bacterium]